MQRKHTLREELQSLLADLRADAPENDAKVTFDTILTRIHEKGFGLLLVLIALPSALPAPAAGPSTVLGAAMLPLGYQLFRGQASPRLPGKLRRARLSIGFLEKVLRRADPLLRLSERVVRPRFSWVSERLGHRIIGAIVTVMASLMIIPIPGTNTAPAMVIFLSGACLIEEDGLLGIVAFLGGIAAVALYAAAIVFMILLFQQYGFAGIEVFIDTLKDFIKGFF